jgi:protein gp37
MSTTKIEWTATRLADGTVLKGCTFNPWQGCYKVSRACKNCYAEKMANRFTPGLWGRTADRKDQTLNYWAAPYRWNQQAERTGIRRKVFCASMADVFELHANSDTNELLNQWRSDLWSLIVATPYLDWLLLTKTPENIMAMVPSDWADDWPHNVWVGATVEDQANADQRIPELIKVPASIRFLSVEPMMGAIDFSNVSRRADVLEVWGKSALKGIHWVIAGGESGSKAEPSHPDWFRSLRDQCAAAGVPFFFKQWGEYAPLNATGSKWAEYRDDGDKYLIQNQGIVPVKWLGEKFTIGSTIMYRVGKKAAGRLLDGREWNEMPKGCMP